MALFLAHRLQAWENKYEKTGVPISKLSTLPAVFLVFAASALAEAPTRLDPRSTAITGNLTITRGSVAYAGKKGLTFYHITDNATTIVYDTFFENAKPAVKCHLHLTTDEGDSADEIAYDENCKDSDKGNLHYKLVGPKTPSFVFDPQPTAKSGAGVECVRKQVAEMNNVFAHKPFGETLRQYFGGHPHFEVNVISNAKKQVRDELLDGKESEVGFGFYSEQMFSGAGLTIVIDSKGGCHLATQRLIEDFLTKEFSLKETKDSSANDEANHAKSEAQAPAGVEDGGVKQVSAGEGEADPQLAPGGRPLR